MTQRIAQWHTVRENFGKSAAIVLIEERCEMAATHIGIDQKNARADLSLQSRNIGRDKALPRRWSRPDYHQNVVA
jgi:hypothetical protein